VFGEILGGLLADYAVYHDPKAAPVRLALPAKFEEYMAYTASEERRNGESRRLRLRSN
jgi:hypothetical protein